MRTQRTCHVLTQSDRQVEAHRLRKAVLCAVHPVARTCVLLTQDMNYEGSTCICRVPRAQLRPGTFVECVHCGTSLRLTPGCRGCSSSD